MKAKLIKTTLADLKPSESPFEVHDTEVPGFLLRVQPSGVMTYYLSYRAASGKRNRLRLGKAPATSPTQARALAKHALSKVTQGLDPAKERLAARVPSLGEFLEERYFPWLDANRRAASKTRAGITSNFRFLFRKSLLDITPLMMAEWRTRKAKGGAKPSTCNRYQGQLHAALGKAVEWGLVAENPLSNMRPEREDRGRVRYLSVAERERLYARLDEREKELREARASYNEWLVERGEPPMPPRTPDQFADHLKPMVVLLLNTGLRRGELFNLEWRDVDLDRHMLTVRGETSKTGSTRRIPLNQEALRTLKTWRTQEPSEGLVFKSPRTGAGFDNIATAWRRLLKEASIEGFRLHDCRHDFASRLAMQGVSLYVIQKLLGHTSTTMTGRYAHLQPEALSAAVASLDLPNTGMNE